MIWNLSEKRLDGPPCSAGWGEGSTRSGAGRSSPWPSRGGTDFLWAIVPAGACHGALLAVLTVGAARAMHWRPAIQRWIGVPLVGWFAGRLSFIPISIYMQSPTSNSIDPGLSAREIVRSLWPFEWSVESLWSPYLRQLRPGGRALLFPARRLAPAEESAALAASPDGRHQRSVGFAVVVVHLQTVVSQPASRGGLGYTRRVRRLEIAPRTSILLTRAASA